MNGAQLHLLLNHLPVIIPIVAIPILIVGLVLKASDIQKVGLWCLVVAALATIPVYLSGDSAESVIKNYPDISRKMISTHENAAFRSLIALEVTGVLSLALLLAFRWGKRRAAALWGLLLVAATTSVLLVAWAAHLGGFIRHEEIRPMDLVQPAPPAALAPSSKR